MIVKHVVGITQMIIVIIVQCAVTNQLLLQLSHTQHLLRGSSYSVGITTVKNNRIKV